MGHSRSPILSLWEAFHLNPLPEGRGHVKLCSLRRHRRGERGAVNLGALCRRSRRGREPGLAGCSCPRLCFISIVECSSIESDSAESAPTLYRGHRCGVYSVWRGLSCSWPSLQPMQKFINGSTVTGECIFLIRFPAFHPSIVIA